MEDQVKVILWTCPRTVSSAFLKCLDKVPDSKMLFEMYSTAKFFGPEREIPQNQAKVLTPQPDVVTDKTPEELEKDPGSGFHSSICTYKWLKHHMETGYPDKKLVFSKEMSFCAAGKFEYLPDSGYRHAFLIRNPTKVICSWVQQLTAIASNDNGQFGEKPLDEPLVLPCEELFQHIYELYSYVKEKGLDPDPVILDADDLVNDPATILSGFCKTLGIPYSDELLSWDAGVEVVNNWTVSQPLKNFINTSDGFKNFRNSTCFFKPNVKCQAPEPEMSTDINVQHFIDISMPHYTEMHRRRLKESVF